MRYKIIILKNAHDFGEIMQEVETDKSKSTMVHKFALIFLLKFTNIQ